MDMLFDFSSSKERIWLMFTMFELSLSLCSRSSLTL